MAFLVVLIINDPEDCPALLDAWEEAGVSGLTILESSGLGRVRKAGMRDDMPLMPSLQNIFGSSEVHHRTLMSVVENQEMVDRLVRISRELMGDLEEPNSGFLFVVPVTEVYGLRDIRSKE